MAQKLSKKAKAAKKKRDLAMANTRRREKMRAENQKSAEVLKKRVKILKAKTMIILRKSLFQ